MKKTKIIVPALAVLLLSTAASVSGTVAWFSMNTTINVTGMTVTTKVSSSLQIAETNAEANFDNADLTQARKGILEPASTINGKDFFFTTDAKSNGDARQNTYVAYSEDAVLGDDPSTDAITETDFDTNALENVPAGKTHFDKDFNTSYAFNNPSIDTSGSEPVQNVCYGYIDYSFYLKAFLTSGEKISLTRCNMKYNNAALSTEHAWRVAFFAHEVNLNQAEDNDTTVAASGALKTILNFAESKNQNQVVGELLANETPVDSATYFTDAELQHAVAANTTANGSTVYYKAASGELDPKAVSATTGEPIAVLGRNTTAHENNPAEIVPEFTAPATSGNKVYKVVVRLWLEGEDVTCRTDTFAELTKDWALDLGFKLGSDNGVKVISNNAPAA